MRGPCRIRQLRLGPAQFLTAPAHQFTWRHRPGPSEYKGRSDVPIRKSPIGMISP